MVSFREYLAGGATQNRTGGEGFADLCLTAWLWRHMEFVRSFEPLEVYWMRETGVFASPADCSRVAHRDLSAALPGSGKTIHRIVFFTRLQSPRKKNWSGRRGSSLKPLVACASRFAPSGFRSPAAKNNPQDCFLHAASIPSESCPIFIAAQVPP